MDETSRLKSEEEQTKDSKPVILITTIDYFHKMYGRNCEGDDKKAVQLFANYESQEKLRRLQQELINVKNGKVTEKICDQVIGKKRARRHESYSHWAQVMLHWIVSRKK